MCAILDANARDQVFGEGKSKAGKQFLQWLNSPNGRLVTGGQLTQELAKSSQKYQQWAQQAGLAGKLKTENQSQLSQRTVRLKHENLCRSNDWHIIALAQLSGARLLYSSDRDLHADFKNKALVDNPRGKIYPTGLGDDKARKRLLGTRDLCRKGSRP